MEDKINAIVLKAVDYRDYDKMLTLFSVEKGIVSAGIKGVKRSGAKLKFAAQPFCFCEYILSVSGGRATVTQASLVEGFYALREDIANFYSGAAALEYCRLFLQEDEPNPKLFFMLAEFLKTLEFSRCEAKLALCKFLFSALADEGYGIPLGNCQKCAKTLIKRVFFDFYSGEFECEDCAVETAKEMSLATYNLLGKLGETEYSFLNALEASNATVRKCLKFFAYYVEVRTGIKLRAVNELITLE